MYKRQLLAPPPAPPEAVPPHLLRPPTKSVPIGTKWAITNPAVVAPRLREWGYDPAHPLQPTEIRFHSAVANEHVASSTLRALHGAPLLSDTWQRPRGRGAPVGVATAPQGAAVPGGDADDDVFPLAWVCPFMLFVWHFVSNARVVLPQPQQLAAVTRPQQIRNR